MDYALSLAKNGDTQSEAMAKLTLEGQRNLLDPVWGGMYQYSTHGDWRHPHFEKIMSVQAENMRVYAQAYAQFKNPHDLETAQAIHRFLTRFLKSPTGAFYTSMDADVVQGQHSDDYFQRSDTERLQIGVPRIDKHLYARENGWVIHALCALYEASGEKTYLEEALTAANWIIQNRSLSGGGFRHDEHDAAGPYLGDNVAMGRAFVSLYRVSADRNWLTHAQHVADFIEKNFTQNNQIPGYTPYPQTVNAALAPVPNRDENVSLARFSNNLYHVTGEARFRAMAENAMRYLATPEISEIPFSASTLLADSELAHAPLHITIVGHKDNSDAQALFQSALSYPSIYKRIDWWDKREGNLPNPDVTYPELEKPAAFICTDKRCSLPIYEPAKIAAKIDRIIQSTQLPQPPIEANRETRP